MKPKIIKTDEEYSEALARVEALMDAKPGSAREEELELWSLLVESYEKEQFPGPTTNAEIEPKHPVPPMKIKPGPRSHVPPFHPTVIQQTGMKDHGFHGYHG